MVDFTFHAPTEVHLGTDSENLAPQLIKKYGGTKVLVHYGSKSAVRSGLISRLEASLKSQGVEFISLGGVVANPQLELVRKGTEIGLSEGVDFILAVGGGSVIDSAKAIAYALAEPEEDVWDLFLGQRRAKGCLPIACVLTIPAAGSEMSSSCVISNGSTKRSYDDDLCRSKFSLLDPKLCVTLPSYQISCGITDIMMHTIERFFSPEDDMDLTDAIAEGLLKTVYECGPKLLRDTSDLRLWSQIMWAGSLSHNGITGCGMVRDFATHKLEHELSGMFGVAHGAGLAALWCHWAEYVIATRPARFARFAVNVLGVPNHFRDDMAVGLEGIDRMRSFFRGIGMPVNIPELIGREATAEEITAMADSCSRGGTITIGGFRILGKEDMVEIYRNANRRK